MKSADEYSKVGWLKASFGIISISVLLSACASSPTLEKLPSNPNALVDQNTKKDDNSGTQYSYRDFNFDSDSVTVKPEIKILLTIDNSESMIEEQQLLSDGIGSMLDALKPQKLNLQFILITTTESGDAADKAVSTELTSYVYEQGGQQIITEDPTRFQSEEPLTLRKTWPLNPPIKGKLDLKFRADMSSAEFDNVAAELRTQVSSIGPNGSNDEASFCGIGRVLAEQAADRKLVKEGDTVGVVIISDSDDASTDVDCLYKKDTDYGEVTDSTLPRPDLVETSDRFEAELWEYKVRWTANDLDRIRIEYYYNSVCYQDGQPYECEKVAREYPTASSLGFPEPISTTNVSCTQEVLAWAQSRQPSRDIIESSCVFRYYYSTITDTYNDESYMLSNLCIESFSHSGVAYSNVVDYFFRTRSRSDYHNTACTSRGFKTPSYAPISYDRDTKVYAKLDSTSSNLEEAIISKSNALFGEDGYYFSTIVSHETLDPVCEPGQSEKEADKYLDFISALNGDTGTSSSICAANYYPALQKLEDFITQKATTTYQISLEEGESIDKVKIIFQDGRTVELVEGTDYTVNAGTIRLEEGVLPDQERVQFIVTLKREI